MGYNKSPFVMEVKSKNNEGYWLFNTWNRKLKFLNNTEYDEYRNGKLDGKKLSILTRDMFMIDENINIDQWSQNLYVEKCLSDKILFITIMPTMACNFCCFYCYEDHDVVKMTADMQQLVVKAICNRMKEYDGLHIQWFGGEPLLELKAIINISFQLIEYCRKNKKSYIASMTTNGYLLSYETFNLLKTKCKIMYYQVTVDGIKADHDRSRPLIGGEGTYEKIITNLKEIKKNEKSALVEICIRTNYTMSNIPHRHEWEKYLHEEFLHDSRFKYISKIAWNNHKNKLYDDKYLPLKFGSSLFNLDHPITSNDNLIYVLKDLSVISQGDVCYASKPNAVVIGPNGRLMKCTVHLYNCNNDIGYINVDGEFVIYSSKEAYWVNETIDAKCSSCSVFPICLAGSGCRQRHRAHQDWCDKEKMNVIRHIEALQYDEKYVAKMWN